MLTSTWTPLRYHEQQSTLWRTKARYCAVAAGRGSGKTEIARRRVVRFLPIKKPWPNPLYFYALPTFSQAKRVAWEPILSLIPKHWIAEENKSDLLIRTVFGSTLYVLGLDKSHRAEGVQWDGGIIDESSDQKPGVFERTFLPAFSHRDAWCWRIGVPKRHGIGVNDFRRFFERGGSDPDIESYNWPSSDIVDPEELLFAKQTLDELDYIDQFEASFQRVGGGIFHAFNKEFNVTKDAEYDHRLPICVCSDFNVDPMSWCLAHIKNDNVFVFDEISARNTNTESTLDRLYRMYANHRSGWEFYGDATGRARKTSASSSDYAQIRNDNRFTPKRVYYLRSNPPRADRFASCNAMFKNALGVRRCFINPKCKWLIKDLEDRNYKPGTSEPDDYGDIGHMTDALGYLIHFKFPMTKIIHKSLGVSTHGVE